MTLEEFIQEMKFRIDEFRSYWIRMNSIASVHFPMEISNTSGIWTDQFQLYMENHRKEMPITLEEYSKQLGLTPSITVDELIESHRYLVNELKTYRSEFLNELQETLAKAYQDAYQTALSEKFIELDKLRTMERK